MEGNDNKPKTPFSQMFNPVQNTESSVDSKKREERRNLYAGLPKKSTKKNSKGSLHTESSDKYEYLRTASNDHGDKDMSLVTGLMKMTVGGGKNANIAASEPNDDQRKLWKKQLYEARQRKANANKWF